MKEYHTTPSNKKYGIDNLPTDDLRLYEEEIKSAPEWERDSLGGDKKSTIHSQREEEEFDFENSRSTKEASSAASSLIMGKEDHH